VFLQAIEKRLTIENPLAYFEICPFPINYEPVMFYCTGPRSCTIKTLRIRNLQIRNLRIRNLRIRNLRICNLRIYGFRSKLMCLVEASVLVHASKSGIILTLHQQAWLEFF
jgi:hypothetical protein